MPRSDPLLLLPLLVLALPGGLVGCSVRGASGGKGDDDSAADDSAGDDDDATGADGVCEPWTIDRLGLSEGGWTGDVGICDPVDTLARGSVPFEVMFPRWYPRDDTGWAFQSDTLDFGGAQVTVTRDGQPLAVDVVPLGAGVGSTDAINILPRGRSSKPGRSYAVEVSGTFGSVAYTVEFVDRG